MLEFAWPSLTSFFTLLDIVIVVLTMIWVLTVKREPMTAVAWCLLVILIPLFGVLLFFFFGYQSLHRPLRRKKLRAQAFRAKQPREPHIPAQEHEELALLARQLGAGQLVGGNAITLFHTGAPAFDAMLAAIRTAKQHIHMQFFITRADASGRLFMETLAERARAGVEVRFLYDAVGSWSLHSSVLRLLTQAGGQAQPFLPLPNPLRRRLRINLRNHRKILLIDGQIAFTGGLNIGDEYLGYSPFFGAWRDTHLRLAGPAVRDLQRVFAEDWDFATNELLEREDFFPPLASEGNAFVQVAWSGPDQELKPIREVYFAAIMRARTRLWLTTPYFVPDASLLDALCLAARTGRDVRIICPFRPDKWVPHFASRYCWAQLLAAGVKIYQYTAGFMHAKTLLMDEAWCSVGTVNFDNRSFNLNFEVTCLIEDRDIAQQLEQALLVDMSQSIRVRAKTFAHRPFISKIAENACRLLSPIL